nr:hypothetical protein M8286_08715 [Streptococcus suis]
MKINKSVEQAVYVLIILALQEDHRPVKSHVLSQVLQVSDSYLKKNPHETLQSRSSFCQCQQGRWLPAGTVH